MRSAYSGETCRLGPICDGNGFIKERQEARSKQGKATIFTSAASKSMFLPPAPTNSMILPSVPSTSKGTSLPSAESTYKGTIVSSAASKSTNLPTASSNGTILPPAAASGTIHSSSASTPCVPENYPHEGFPNTKNEIMELLSPAQGAQLRLISIVGCGGLGKSALAGAVYEAAEINPSPPTPNIQDSTSPATKNPRNHGSTATSTRNRNPRDCSGTAVSTRNRNIQLQSLDCCVDL